MRYRLLRAIVIPVAVFVMSSMMVVATTANIANIKGIDIAIRNIEMAGGIMLTGALSLSGTRIAQYIHMATGPPALTIAVAIPSVICSVVVAVNITWTKYIYGGHGSIRLIMRKGLKRINRFTHVVHKYFKATIHVFALLDQKPGNYYASM